MTSWDSREMRLKVMLSPSPLVRSRRPVCWQARLGRTKEPSGAPSWTAEQGHCLPDFAAQCWPLSATGCGCCSCSLQDLRFGFDVLIKELESAH